MKKTDPNLFTIIMTKHLLNFEEEEEKEEEEGKVMIMIKRLLSLRELLIIQVLGLPTLS